MSAPPKVWIGCLASYNAGRLIGEWVDATDADEMQEAQQQVAAQAIAAAKAAGEWPVYFGTPEEFFIADYDGFGHLASSLGEYASYELVAKVGSLIEEHGAAFIAWAETLDELDDVDSFQDHYRGEWDSEEAFAMDYVENCGWAGIYPTPENPDPFDGLWSYLDMSAIARELFRHGNYTYRDGYVFEEEV